VFTCVHACPRCGKDHGHAIRNPSSPLDAFELYCVPCSRIEAEQINNGTFHEPVRRRTAGRVSLLAQALAADAEADESRWLDHYGLSIEDEEEVGSVGRSLALAFQAADDGAEKMFVL
jgi:hypothetical protein